MHSDDRSYDLARRRPVACPGAMDGWRGAPGDGVCIVIPVTVDGRVDVDDGRGDRIELDRRYDRRRRRAAGADLEHSP